MLPIQADNLMIAVHMGKGLGANRPPFSCGAPSPPLDRRSTTARRVFRMGLDAVAAILIFVVALAALNRYEFGRFD
jgi:hypothetical protein